MQIVNKVLGKVAYWKRGLVFFIWKEGNGTVLPERSDVLFEEVTELSLLSSGNYSISQMAEYAKRFGNKEILCVLQKNEAVVCYGWVNPNPTHYVGELDIDIQYPESVEVLYNFETEPSMRGQGLYPYLLSKICERNNKSKIIYAVTENAASIHGIKKASFTHLGSIYGFNKKKIHQLIQQVWQE